MWRRILSGISAALVLSPAMLKHLVGAIAVTLILRQVSETPAKGTYSFPGSAMSQWISSEITVTPYFAQSSPTLESSSFVQMRPTGLCGLQRIMSEVCGSASFFSRSSKSISQRPSLRMRGFSRTRAPLFTMQLKKML